MKTALVFILAFTTALADKNYLIETYNPDKEAHCPIIEPDIKNACTPSNATCCYGEECCCGKCHCYKLYQCEESDDSVGRWRVTWWDKCLSPRCPGGEKSMAIEKLEENEPKASGEKKTPNTKNSQNMEEAEEIITRSGSVRGKRMTSEEGFSHFEYLGIPYAQPPIGELRFQNPIPVKPWIETLDATKAGPVCYQKGNFGFGLGEMSEDCLTLNIYTQDKNLDSKPVMIWIHGGGFTIGAGSQYIPVKLIREGVIVVTLNYRLGSLGFLTFGNNLVSGNMGLKDQQLAIRWVKQNIERFGGDPEQITLFGESAGGISVHAHVLSPWNYGLIKGAIAQSGTMLIYSNSRQNEERFARTAADRLGCENDDLGEETLRCLQAVDIDQLNKDLDPGNANFNKIKGPAPFEWRPVIDKYSSNPFLPLESLEALKTGTFNRIPFMSGTVKNEGALMFGILRGAGWSRANLTEFWKYVGPSLILQSPSVGDYTPQERDMATISLKYYNHPVEETIVGLDQPWMDLMGDAAFLSPDQKSVGLMSQYSPAVFNYYFTQQVATSLLAQLFKFGQEYTPVHADDIAFLFDFIVQNMTIRSSDGDKKLSSKMVKYWTNFAKYGHPTPSSDDDLPTWIPTTTTDKNYMELKFDPEMKQDLHNERMQFWENMIWREKEEKIERKMLYCSRTFNKVKVQNNSK